MDGSFAAAEEKLQDCSSGYSFYFNLIENEWIGENRAPIHRICTLMRKMGVRSFLRETLELNQELSEERDAVSVRVGRNVEAAAVRLTFFRSMPASGDWRELEETDIIGYAVLLTLAAADATPLSYVYEAVVRPPSLFRDGKWRCVSNYYVHCAKQFKTVVGTRASSRAFIFPGTFFCQQNSLTHVCAHAAVRIALNNWPQFSGPKVTTRTVNEALGIDHTTGKQVPDGGLTSQQIKRVVEKLGYGISAAEFLKEPDVDYDEFVYPIIESGSPVVLGVVGPGVAHVVAVIGHTLNSDRWAEARHTYGTFPRQPYITTSSWVDHFIVSDDNFGMYVTLPSETIRNLLVPKYNPNLHAAVAVGLIRAKGDVLSGYLAEKYAAGIANTIISRVEASPDNKWLRHLQKEIASKRVNPIVCRSLAITRADYLTQIKSMVDESGARVSQVEQTTLERALPEYFWVTEVSTANLYTGNKRKLGEIVTLISPSNEEIQKQEFHIFAWLTGVCWIGPGLAKGPFNWSIKGHVPLFRGIPRETCENEW